MSRKNNMQIPLEYVTIDTETTGSSQILEPIEVSAVRMRDGIEIASYSTLVEPEQLPVPRGIELLTGIRSEELYGAPGDGAAVAGLIEFVGDDAVAGHNVGFDLRVVCASCRRNGMEEPEWESVDSLALSRRFLPGLADHKLGTVFSHLAAESWDEPWFSGTAHRALYDARMCAYVLEQLREYAREDGDAWSGDA
jgi:DNA polymerase III epsilon subunit-like protein